MINRRVFVGDLARLAALAAFVPNDWRVLHRPRLAGDPFTLGLASGDPNASGATIWTRLALQPLQADGGMDGSRIAVKWEVANDEKFASMVRSGMATATPELAYSVHVNVDGLDADRWYFYRFMAGDATTQVGRLRTAPADGALTPLRFAFVSCQNYEQGLFTAYQHLAKEDVDLVAHLGDYIYEYAPTPGKVRAHLSPLCMTLGDYRQRYAQYKSDPNLQASHAARPWIVIWDDHEVSNNYAGLIGETPNLTPEIMHARRAAAYQAWWEHTPVSVPASGDWSNLSITRTINWGALAQFWMLDTRQFRSDQPCGDGSKVVPCGDWADSTHTLMGDKQEKWLVDGIGASKSRWQILANQVMMAPYDSQLGPGERVSMDQWSGYPVARDRLLGEVAKRAPNRTVVVTGDIHSNWVNELRSTFATPGAPTIGAEFVGTSISSGGDGSDRSSYSDASLADNPHLKWQNNRRGYVTCAVTADDCRADYRTVPFVSKPDAPVETASSWVVQNGVAGIQWA